MCGISGIINRLNQPVDPGMIREINDAVAHRGPDGEGFYDGANFALGHRRLSILDLSANGHQPMFFKDELVLVFNGEIYNYIEIRDELLKQGYTFHSGSDTEVILAAYHCWGTACVTRFNGMWAFALFDKQKNMLFCSRDRFGVKPFYYALVDSLFVFGSEIKQLLRVKKEAVLNRKIALDYLIAGLEEHTNETFFEGVLKLPPSHNIVYDLSAHTFSVQRYYEVKLDKEVAVLGETEAVALYAAEFERSVSLRLRSDVKVGTCLSGGLDSSSVAAVAGAQYAKSSGQKFIAIHARSTEKETDESSLAKEVSDHCRLDLHVVEPAPSDFIASLDEVVYTQEEPFGSPSVFMQYFVLKKARELNCIVMLDGQGGDETLLGYEKYYPAYLSGLKGMEKWRGFLRSSQNSKLSRKQVLFYFLYFTRYGIRLRRLKRRNRHFKPEVLRTYESAALKQMAGSYLDIRALQLLELSSTQLPHLLKYEDKNSMRNSVETRLPFLDYKVVETALSVDNRLKIKDGWTKYLLRKGVEKLLPASIVWRKNKLGFNAPEKTWLMQIRPEMEKEIKASPLLQSMIDFNRFDFSKSDLRSTWRLFNFARWEKLYHVKDR